MAKKQTDHDYVLGLEENAFSSLEHGVEHYLEGEDRDLKFTVLHVFHAVELLLKARLAKAHPLLLINRPEEGLEKNTADYTIVLMRLKQVGVDFSKDDIDNLNSLRTTRNRIEHYKLEGNRQQIEDYVARAVKLLDRFVEKELGTLLKDRIRPDLYEEMKKVVYTHDERVSMALEQIHEVIKHIKYPNDDEYYAIAVCEECKQQTVLLYDLEVNNGEVRCYFCDAIFYCEFCENCGEPVLSSEPVGKEENTICMLCWDDVFGPSS